MVYIGPTLWHAPFPIVGAVLCFLPLFAACFCIVWSLLFDFRASTATECRVPNYLPSLSAAIGGSTPQRYVWRICICLHAAPRFLMTFAYSGLHSSIVELEGRLERHALLYYQALVKCAALFNVVEVGSLVGLTYISSTENYDVHEMLFVTFMVGGLLYMMVTIALFSWRHRLLEPSHMEHRSLLWKMRLFTLNLSIFLVSIYLFFRHNWYCEPGVYTAFAVCEYLVVVTNIGFHGTVVWDFAPVSLACASTALVSPCQHQLIHPSRSNNSKSD